MWPLTMCVLTWGKVVLLELSLYLNPVEQSPPRRAEAWREPRWRRVRNGKEPEARTNWTWTWLAGSWSFFPNVGVQEVLGFVKKCFNNEEEIMQTNEVCNHITVSWYDRLLPPFGTSTVCLEILLHLCSQEACLPFVWETSHNLSWKRMRRCWLSDAHFHLDDLNTILTWKSGQGFTLQIP